ncbi:hypothetical protein MUG91_G93n48 [Manis pentadactyla]|nr:hypothetical protein MUG91_G93n48 [Manis pentadactyla]
MRRRFFREPCSRGLTSAHLDTPGTDEALEGVQWHFSEEAGAVAVLYLAVAQCGCIEEKENVDCGLHAIALRTAEPEDKNHR